jgi:ATP-dependent DNA helicase RecG
MIESETKEFKKTTRELNEGIISITSILNKHKHGELFFGIKNDGSPFKFDINDSTLRDISRKIYEAIKPQIFPNIEIIYIDGIKVIKVEFSGTDTPYSAFGKYYIRIADENRELTPNELKKMMISKEYEENWCDKLTSFTIDDINEDCLLKFYESATECGRLPKIGFNKKTLLVKHNLLRNGFLTNAGVMLFGATKPITLKLVVFATNERITILDMKTMKGNIFELIDESMDFVIKNIRWKVVIDEGSLQRKEIPEIPLIALREVIINSFAHARYDGNVQHEIDIYSNRIAIINPGSFANNYMPNDFFNKDLKSYLRNQSIADVLYLCKDVETCGHGLKKVYHLCEEANVSISYINNENDFTIEFSRIDRNESGEINGEINGEISEEEFSVLAVFKSNKNAIKDETIKQTGLSSRTIDRIIKSLKQKGLLRRIGSNKNGYWEVLK